jgi:hypothetical protein
VTVLDYSDYANDPEIIGQTIVSKLDKYSSGRMLERNSPNEPWPILGQNDLSRQTNGCV